MFVVLFQSFRVTLSTEPPSWHRWQSCIYYSCEPHFLGLLEEVTAAHVRGVVRLFQTFRAGCLVLHYVDVQTRASTQAWWERWCSTSPHSDWFDLILLGGRHGSCTLGSHIFCQIQTVFELAPWRKQSVWLLLKHPSQSCRSPSTAGWAEQMLGRRH